MGDDIHDVLAAISAVLKAPISPSDLKYVKAKFDTEVIHLEYKGHKGFITRRDAKGWDVSLGEIRKALSRAWQVGHKPQFSPARGGRDWTREDDHDSIRRMMGITPSLMEHAAGLTEASSLDVQVVRSKHNRDYVKLNVSGSIGKTPFRGEGLPIATSLYRRDGTGGEADLEPQVWKSIQGRIFKQKGGDWDNGRGSEIPVPLLHKVVKAAMAKLK